VADACANWGTLLTRPKGLYLSADDAACAGGRGLRAVVDSWKLEDEEKEKGGKRDSPLLPPRLAVVSDGARILALEDLAAHGMGIPVGKCFLHSAGGGLSPQECLPVIVDAGRGSETERNDLFYLGRRAPRLRGAAYAAFLTEALQALRGRFGPRFIIHLEDFAGRDAAALLEKEEGANLPCFDDDIQATGGKCFFFLSGIPAGSFLRGQQRAQGRQPLPFFLREKKKTSSEKNFFGKKKNSKNPQKTFKNSSAAAVAAVLAATRGIEGVPPLADQIFLFLGAGQAAVGVARCAAAALRAPVSEGGAGLSEREARDRMFLVDSKGVVVSAAGDKAAAPSASLKAEFARAADDPVVLKLRGNGGSKSPPSLAEIVTAVGPTTLVGAAGVAGAFDSSVLRALATSSPSSFRPIVLALSNPTAFSECTPQEAADATSGRAVFASGSPFADYSVKGDRAARKGLRRASQANNALVFPGVALGLVAADASGLGGGKAEAALLPAARALAGLVTAEDFEEDAVLPRVNLLPAVTRAVAASVALAAIAGGRSGPRCLPALRRAAEKIERARTDGDEAAAEKAALKDAEEAISKIQFDGEAAFATSFA